MNIYILLSLLDTSDKYNCKKARGRLGSPYTFAVRGMQTARRRVGRCRAAFWQENLSVSAAESLQAGQLGGTLQHCPIGALQVANFFVFRLDNEAEA